MEKMHCDTNVDRSWAAFAQRLNNETKEWETVLARFTAKVTQHDLSMREDGAVFWRGARIS